MAEPFAEYRGLAYLDRIDPDQRDGLYAWGEILRLGCGDLVDGNYFIESQIYLCAETAEYIYTDYTPTTVNYERGSRPFLDKVIDGLHVRGLPDFEKFLWLGRFVRDLPDARGWDLGREAQDGGTEEELIEKRAAVCNEQARLMVILCQVAGLPARYVGHHIGGHGVTEVCIDGRWSYFDTRGRFFLKADGRPASTWEIRREPAIIRRQADWVQREIHPRYLTCEVRPGEFVRDPYVAPERNFFNPKECTGVVNYFVADHAKFNYGRDWPMSAEDRRRTDELLALRRRAKERMGMVCGF